MAIIQQGEHRMVVFDDNDIERRVTFDLPPDSFGWEEVRLTREELNALQDYADAGMINEASEVVDRAYARLFGNAIQ